MRKGYVRQSTLHQVVENTESTRRQYALRDGCDRFPLVDAHPA